ncbi:DUF6876 family protein [Arundinibacter roseus]|uniref:DUF6876 domain-containing protein n=1 Tax=Arundinibacter roseus TaxID=2070510 RepID=A0A4R4KFV9_9BACT|nr:DUF6876 family protein [Arundinibacter roseus]TDB66818.1 hypothetical protein EZE20_06745 [Arundinibacter roseus]
MEVQFNLNERYQQYCGTENLYQHWLPGMWFTDGAKAVAEEQQCFWLLDIIASHQLTQGVVGNYFQVWKLLRQKQGEFEVRCDDGNGKTLVSQCVWSPHFDHDLLTLWCVDGIMMVPSEY